MFNFLSKGEPISTVSTQNKSYATNKYYSNDECFVTGTSIEKDSYKPVDYKCPCCGATLNFNGKRFIAPVDKNLDRLSTVVEYEEVKEDLLNFPAYYNIVYGIPADLSLGSETAKRLDNFYNIKETCIDNDYDMLSKGDVIWIHNLFVLLIADKKYEAITMETLQDCFTELAHYCVNENVKYLAMPRIGCGHGGLDWEDVRSMIIKTFIEVINDEREINDECDKDYKINISFCYK